MFTGKAEKKEGATIEENDRITNIPSEKESIALQKNFKSDVQQ